MTETEKRKKLKELFTSNINNINDLYQFKKWLENHSQQVLEYWKEFGDEFTIDDFVIVFKELGFNYERDIYRKLFTFLTYVKGYNSLFKKGYYRYLPELDKDKVPERLWRKYYLVKNRQMEIRDAIKTFYTLLVYYSDAFIIQNEKEQEVVGLFKSLFGISNSNTSDIDKQEITDTYDKIKKLNQFSSTTIQELQYPIRKKIIEKFKNYTGWVITFSDLHVPYINWKQVITALKFVNSNFGGNKLLVLGGDILDFEQFSGWGERKRINDIPYDIIAVAEFLNIIYNLFDNIIIIEGNHERRLYNYLFKQLDKNAPYLINFVNVPDLIRKYTSPEAQEKIIFSPDWYAIIGEMIISHNNKASVVKGKSVQMTIDYFHDNLNNTRFKALMQAHTHTQVKLRHQGVWGLEIGMLGKDPSYRAVKSSRIKPLYGFGYGQLIDGKFLDPNKFNFVYLGEDYIDDMVFEETGYVNPNPSNIETIDIKEMWGDIFALFNNIL